jgi:hypothetical protein
MTVVKGHFRNEICVALFHDLKLAEKSFLSMPLGSVFDCVRYFWLFANFAVCRSQWIVPDANESEQLGGNQAPPYTLQPPLSARILGDVLPAAPVMFLFQ